MKFVNLTPHEINIVREDGSTLNVPPSGIIARREEVSVPAESIDGIRTAVVVLGEISNMPEEVEGVAYIVSSLCLDALEDRSDVFAPGDFVRDTAGRLTGCGALKRSRRSSFFESNTRRFYIDKDHEDYGVSVHHCTSSFGSTYWKLGDILIFDTELEAVRYILDEIHSESL